MLKTFSNSKRCVQVCEITTYIFFSTQCSFQSIAAFPPSFTTVIVMDNFFKKILFVGLHGIKFINVK